MNLRALSTAALEKIRGRGPKDSAYERAIEEELASREQSRRPDNQTLSLFTAAEMEKGPRHRGAA